MFDDTSIPMAVRLTAAGAVFLSFLFMSFVVSWTILDVLTFNIRGY